VSQDNSWAWSLLSASSAFASGEAVVISAAEIEKQFCVVHRREDKAGRPQMKCAGAVPIEDGHPRT
jgi:hypothetical protein